MNGQVEIHGGATLPVTVPERGFENGHRVPNMESFLSNVEEIAGTKYFKFTTYRQSLGYAYTYVPVGMVVAITIFEV